VNSSTPQASNLAEPEGNRPPQAASAGLLWLERVAAAVLLAVILVLGWMVLRAFQPEALGSGWIETEALLILVLLAAALILVSVVALVHTR
jgi:hypothetical protein